VHRKIILVHVLPWQIQEFVFVLPAQRILLELLGLGRWKWRLGNLRDEVCRGGLRETVDEDAHKRDLDENVEAKAETEEHTSSVLEPQLLLLFVVANTCEVRLELMHVSLIEVW
jgi:hypothetical protein